MLHHLQQQRSSRHSHHLHRSTGLVQLRLGLAQSAHIKRNQIGITRILTLQHEAAHLLDRAIDGFTQLIQHPRQRSDINIAPCRHVEWMTLYEGSGVSLTLQRPLLFKPFNGLGNFEARHRLV